MITLRLSLCFIAEARSRDEDLDRGEGIISVPLYLWRAVIFSSGSTGASAVSAQVSFHLCWRGKKDTVLRVPSILIDRATGLSAGFRTNQCEHLHENIFDEKRWSETRSARISWHETALNHEDFYSFIKEENCTRRDPKCQFFDNAHKKS